MGLYRDDVGIIQGLYRDKRDYIGIVLTVCGNYEEPGTEGSRNWPETMGAATVLEIM